MDARKVLMLAGAAAIAFFAYQQSAGAAASTQSVADLKALASLIAHNEGIDPALFRAVIQQESYPPWNPYSLSSSGAIGLTQLMPATALLMLVNPYDIRQNLIGGARYLKQQLATFGNVDMALAAYNAGPGTVRKAIAYSTAHGITWQAAMRQFQSAANFAQTQNYVSKVKSYIGKV